MEDNIQWEVRQLHNHRSGGTSGMRDNHIKGWLLEAWKDETAVVKTAVMEGTSLLIGGTGGENT